MTGNKGTCSSDDERQGFYSLDMCTKEGKWMDDWMTNSAGLISLSEFHHIQIAHKAALPTPKCSCSCFVICQND